MTSKEQRLARGRAFQNMVTDLKSARETVDQAIRDAAKFGWTFDLTSGHNAPLTALLSAQRNATVYQTLKGE